MFPRRTRPTFTLFLVISIAFLLLGMLWLIQPSLTTRAQSQPEALGSLSGAVVNGQGQPLPAITVWLEHYKGQSYTRKVETDANGQYTFASVLSGAYRLRFEDALSQYATQYYVDAHFADDATNVTVNGNNVTGVNMSLQNAGTISVTIQSSEVFTSNFAVLTLYRQTAGGWWSAYAYHQLYAQANGKPALGSEGVLLDKLPPGDYRLCIEAHGINYNYTGVECYDNVLPENVGQLPPDTNDIAVQAGQQTNVTLVLNDVPQVQGHVTDPAGQPLAGIFVRAFPQQSYPDQYVQTDENGYFTFGYLPSNSYYLEINAPLGFPNSYLPVYYPDGFFGFTSAVPVAVGPSTRMSITQQLTPEARINGKVTFPGDAPLGNVNMRLLRQGADGLWNGDWCYDLCPFQNYNYETGVFSMTHVVPGTYRIQAEYYIPGTQNYLIAFYGGDSVETADDVTVAEGETKENINIVVGALDFDSAIAGRVTANGAPRAGIEVGLFTAFNNPYYESTMPLFTTSTDADGRYKLEGLSLGQYQVAFRDPQGIYATTFYTGAPFYYLPMTVMITQTGTLEGISMALSPGGALRGHIRTQGNVQAGGWKMQLQSEVGTPYLGAVLPYINVRSASDGSFELTGLPPGRYYLYAISPPSGEYAYGNVRYHPASTEPYFATVLTVEAGKTLTGKDIFVYTKPTSFMPVIGGGTSTNQGQPIYPLPPVQYPPNPGPYPIPTPTPVMYP